MIESVRNEMPASGAGRCLCGDIRYEWTAAPLWTGYCHCESCRRNCAAPLTAFFGVADSDWSWTANTPALFESGPSVRRSFCGRCGTPMAYANDKFAGEIHFYAATMDSPELFAPSQHFHHEEKLPWLALHDSLPRHEGAVL